MIVRLLQATRLNRVAHKIYYNHVHGFQPAIGSTTKGVNLALRAARDTGAFENGDYYEFGLFKGYSFWHAQKTAREMGAETMRFFGFDSFEGLPDVEGPDLTDRGDFYKGQYSCSFEQVRDSLDKAGADWNRTFLTKGFFDESLRPEIRGEMEMGPVAIALIDCDLYASTRDVLWFLEPLLQEGSIVVFDDWNCFDADPNRGQRRARSEFEEAFPRFGFEPLYEYGTWGAGFKVSVAEPD